MELVLPSWGTIFWMCIVFFSVLFILKKFAWKPIMDALKEREESIEGALQAAEKAKIEMATMQAKNEELLKQAQQEREAIIREAREIKEKTISDAKKRASEEADAIIISARESIQNEKIAAIIDLKNQMTELTLQIAEKVIKQELSNSEKSQLFIGELVKDVQLK